MSLRLSTGVVVVILFAEFFVDKGVGVLEEEVGALRVGGRLRTLQRNRVGIRG